MTPYDHKIQVLPLRYKPRGKAGRFTVSHSWLVPGVAGRRLATTYHATRADADAYAAELKRQSQ